jgi:hypothetical protein
MMTADIEKKLQEIQKTLVAIEFRWTTMFCALPAPGTHLRLVMALATYIAFLCYSLIKCHNSRAGHESSYIIMIYNLYSSLDEWINILWYTHTMGNYSPVRKKGPLILI